jgi:hypothetical protein
VWRPNSATVSSVLTALLFAASGTAAQPTVTLSGRTWQSDGSAANVQKIHDRQASDGDTITLPPGTFSWTTGVTISKGITLQGSTTTDVLHKTAADKTIIQDSVTRNAGGSAPLVTFSTTAGKSYRMTGITFATGTVTTDAQNGMIVINGTSQSVRIDNNHFKMVGYQSKLIEIDAWVYGVIDHNELDFRTPPPYQMSVFYRSDGYGDVSWANPAFYGSNKFVFVEDNTFNNASTNNYNGCSDATAGGRVVFRHNHLYNSVLHGNHGTDPGRQRGGRCVEIYNNDFHYTAALNLFGIRSGGMLTHDNTWDGTAPGSGIGLQCYQMFDPNPTFTGSNGTRVWDVNVTESNGTHVNGHPPYLYDSGTAGTGSSSTQVVDTSKSWTTNQWAGGYAVKRVSDNKFSAIVSNTATTLIVTYDTTYGGGSAVWASADQYEIHKALVLLDQPGRGAGDLITGDAPIDSVTGTATWPNQALEPIYSWNDVYTPTSTPIFIYASNLGNQSQIVHSNVEYYNGYAMPGYTPYCYPHPLTTSLSAPQPSGGVKLGSRHHFYKKEKNEAKKTGRKKWGHAKENLTNEMTQPDQ